jgi:hypothetical protein
VIKKTSALLFDDGHESSDTKDLVRFRRSCPACDDEFPWHVSLDEAQDSAQGIGLCDPRTICRRRPGFVWFDRHQFSGDEGAQIQSMERVLNGTFDVIVPRDGDLGHDTPRLTSSCLTWSYCVTR